MGAQRVPGRSRAGGRVRGVAVREAGLSACVAGHFNVPVIMISGDDAIVKDAGALLGGIEGAVVKWAYGFHSARTLMPEAAYELIRQKVKQAIGRIKDFKPYKIKAPIQLIPVLG